MPNSIKYASMLTTELDKMFVQSAVTGFMTDNAMRAKFVGAHTVLIPEMDLDGLGTYNRQTGYPDGAINVSHNSYTLSQDRGRSFLLDAQDEDESGVANLAGQVLGEFVRTKVVPEVDAYVMSKLFHLAMEKTNVVNLPEGKTIANGAYAVVNNLISKVRSVVGYDEELVALLDDKVYAALMATPEITRMIRTDDFKKGEITTKVKVIDDVAIIPVPSSRMMQQIEITENGYTVAEGNDAHHIGAIVMPKKAASLIRKTEKIRTFTPEQNQSADAYKFDYRLYYDLLVKNSQKGSIYTYMYSEE